MSKNWLASDSFNLFHLVEVDQFLAVLAVSPPSASHYFSLGICISWKVSATLYTQRERLKAQHW